MAMLLESAAAPARDANRTGSRDLAIRVGIDLQDLAAQLGRGWHCTHSRTTFIRAVISSTENSSPLPAPGQTAHVSAHASWLSTLLSQNGQVRHCRGRAE